MSDVVQVHVLRPTPAGWHVDQYMTDEEKRRRLHIKFEAAEIALIEILDAIDVIGTAQ